MKCINVGVIIYIAKRIEWGSCLKGLAGVRDCTYLCGLGGSAIFCVGVSFYMIFDRKTRGFSRASLITISSLPPRSCTLQ